MNTIKKKLAIYILSYNRPEYIMEAIDSVLSQKYDFCEIIISENSTNELVSAVLKNNIKYKHLKIIKRLPSLASLDHFNEILKEINEYEFAMLFHDDDLLLPNAISKMMAVFDLDPDLSAVGGNAYIVKDKVFTEQIFAPNISENLFILNQAQLIKRYLFRDLSHVPFPSYIYRTSKLKHIFLEQNDGGKHSDATFLVKILKRGKIFWLAEPLMQYRFHAKNDSAIISLKDVYSLCIFFIRTCPELTIYAVYYFTKSSFKRLRQILKNYSKTVFKKTS